MKVVVWVVHRDHLFPLVKGNLLGERLGKIEMPVVLMNLIIVERILGCVLCKTICCLVTRYAHVGFYFSQYNTDTFVVVKVMNRVPDAPNRCLCVAVFGEECLGYQSNCYQGVAVKVNLDLLMIKLINYHQCLFDCADLSV